MKSGKCTCPDVEQVCRDGIGSHGISTGEDSRWVKGFHSSHTHMFLLACWVACLLRLLSYFFSFHILSFQLLIKRRNSKPTLLHQKSSCPSFPFLFRLASIKNSKVVSKNLVLENKGFAGQHFQSAHMSTYTVKERNHVTK